LIAWADDGGRLEIAGKRRESFLPFQDPPMKFFRTMADLTRLFA
jgi:hypothetical protein